MIRKLLCWLGFHEYEIKYKSYYKSPTIIQRLFQGKQCNDCSFYKLYTKECKHCGKVKG